MYQWYIVSIIVRTKCQTKCVSMTNCTFNANELNDFMNLVTVYSSINSSFNQDVYCCYWVFFIFISQDNIRLNLECRYSRDVPIDLIGIIIYKRSWCNLLDCSRIALCYIYFDFKKVFLNKNSDWIVRNVARIPTLIALLYLICLIKLK